MIKLKNLWKIALATMAMSAMLVACDTASDGDKGNSNDGATASGVYSYTFPKSNFASNWGNNSNLTFSVVLLTDEQLKACQEFTDAEGNVGRLQAAAITNPEYQIAANDNMKISGADIYTTDPSTNVVPNGVYAPYGNATVNGLYQYYTGVAVEVKDTTVTVYVDMSKVVKTELVALYDNGEGGAKLYVGDEEGEEWISPDSVNFSNCKPYLVNLVAEDEDNLVFNSWSTTVVKMAKEGSFPTAELKKDAPVPTTCKDLDSYNGTMVDWATEHTALTDNTFTFTAADENKFVFTDGSWDFKAGGVEITDLNKDFDLVVGGSDITFGADVLTKGSSYLVTLTIVDETTAKVKVTAK